MSTPNDGPTPKAAELRRVPPPEESAIHTLFDLLNTGHEACPPFYDAESKSKSKSKKALQSTKPISQAEFAINELPSSDVLKKIVMVPNLVNQLLPVAKQKLSALPIDWNKGTHRRAVQFMHPRYTSLGLSPVFNSEKDVAERVAATILRPAIHAYRAQIYQSLDIDVPPISEYRFPYFASPRSGKVIPDGIFVIESDDPDSDEEIRMILEVKSSRVLRFNRGNGPYLWDPMVDADTAPVKVTEFDWPKGPVPQKAIRLPVQVPPFTH